MLFVKDAASFGLSLAMAGGWAVERIDGKALLEEKRSLSVALEEEKDRLALEQNSSAIWDEAVTNVRANNQAWIAENLTDWMSEYFHHDRVSSQDPTHRPGFPVGAGEQIGPDELMSRLGADSVTLLDVRAEDEFRAGHLPGAMNINRSLEARLFELPLTGRSSPIAADLLHSVVPGGAASRVQSPAISRRIA